MAFLRARREATPPAVAGFPEWPRRRTPGLRRAELAAAAGVSVDYLTRLEQGRDRRPSTEIRTALADALSLSGDERVHLHRLLKASSGICAMSAPLSREVRPTVALLPARVGTERWRDPDGGELVLPYETLDLAGADDQRLVVYLPADVPAYPLRSRTAPRTG
ncbi:helix-turn-helix domain-containing protein [Nonomuraea typhae]|uniref:helix-turn-helix domain-containing protein n=1 Tax=Nonomuraea typhae TaxID=2603600 RepID=UPI0012FC07BC|nr:helix-turn-helix transcriptional regulator [Nonomuraea typhae]